jgi:hypothetical protein
VPSMMHRTVCYRVARGRQPRLAQQNCRVAPTVRPDDEHVGLQPNNCRLDRLASRSCSDLLLNPQRRFVLPRVPTQQDGRFSRLFFLLPSGFVVMYGVAWQPE